MSYRSASWMIRVNSKIGEQERLASRLHAATFWLNRHKHGINLLKLHWIINLHDPALVCRRILKKNTKVKRIFAIGSASPPHLEGAGVLQTGLLVEIEAIKN